MKKLLLFGVVLAMIFATACGGVALPEEGITTTAGEEASRPADTDPAEGDTRLLRLAVNGVSLPDFDPHKTAYTVSAEDVDSMDVEAVAAQEGAVISVAREGASVTVTVTGKNGENQRVYTLDARVALEGKVVNHNGANATVTYVIDDGDQQTAIAVIKNMAEKYPSLRRVPILLPFYWIYRIVRAIFAGKGDAGREIRALQTADSADAERLREVMRLSSLDGYRYAIKKTK